MRLSGRVAFDDLYPGAYYRIYEADEYTQVQTGGQIDRYGALSAPAEALTRLSLETNYQIIYMRKRGRQNLPGDQTRGS